MVDNRWITSIQHAQKRGFALKRITLQCIRNGDVDGMRALFAPQENLSTISGALSDDLDHAVIACLFTWAQAAFAAETGETVVWEKADMPDLRAMMDRVRASSTLPGFMHPIAIDGLTMYDGGLGRGAGIPVRLAEDAGFERMLFVATRPEGYRKNAPSRAERAVFKALSHGMEPLFQAMATRNERYNAEMEHVEELERKGRALVIRPDIVPVKSTTIKTPELLRSYDLGYEQALRDWPRVEEHLFG